MTYSYYYKKRSDLAHGKKYHIHEEVVLSVTDGLIKNGRTYMTCFFIKMKRKEENGRKAEKKNTLYLKKKKGNVFI